MFPLRQQMTSASQSGILKRRIIFAALCSATFCALLGLATAALSVHGLSYLDLILLGFFVCTLPWTVIGFWNAMVGFLVMRLSRDPISTVLPAASRVRGDEPITASTAITVFVRNELPDRVIRNLDALLADLATAGVQDKFHLYVLSDTSDRAVADLEEAKFGALADLWRGRVDITYRRRSANTAFKAGNFWDFCERWGDRHDFALPFDTDSFMPASAILRMLRIMQTEPNLGILQSLVVGLPSTSAFTRIFQFGMRLGMRSWTIGSAWWQGDCGPYWGHNALIRIASFKAHCHIAQLPKGSLLGDHILSHDQIEAALMRKGGYDVRVLPEENLGWEENPPSLVEYLRRDQRWMQGNLQYGRYLFMDGLKFVSRFQLGFAMLMFLSSPAWIGLLVAGTLGAALARAPGDFIDPRLGTMLMTFIFVMWFAPKIATALDVLIRPSLRDAFGGVLRFLGSLFVETLFFILLSPIMWVSHTMFLAGLPFGRTVGWIGQLRDDHRISWRSAARYFWMHTFIGWGAISALALTHPGAIPYALLIAAGPAIAIPFAVLTSIPAVGRFFVRIGLGRLPEETSPPITLAPLALPVFALSPRSRPL